MSAPTSSKKPSRRNILSECESDARRSRRNDLTKFSSTTRSNKFDEVRRHYGDQVEVYKIDDIAKGDYSEAMKGIEYQS